MLTDYADVWLVVVLGFALGRGKGHALAGLQVRGARNENITKEHREGKNG